MSNVIINPHVFRKVNITFTDSDFLATSLTTYTHSAQAIGTAHADRIVVAMVGGRTSGAGTPGITSVTIGGVTATERYLQHNDSRNVAALFTAPVPTGTTADVVVVYAQAMINVNCGTFTMSGAASLTPTATATDGAPDPSVSITVPANGGVFAGMLYANATAIAWTGVTEDYEGTMAAGTVGGGGHANVAAGEVNRTVTATITGTDGTDILIAAAFG